ncbi:S41 family peptidase [Kinneretia aquatilis]|uniref:S41 family peptidase n=1 Tax=Kinneretia aquatilis TaxID=2070761 RepID=UPI0014953038|nr:S41 family peptidase [Paucibacter aquatile]WIV99460.1 S41 family peptidase [Paucibacter aquatile]
MIRSFFTVTRHLAKRVLAVFALSFGLSPLAQAAAPEPSAQSVYAQALALSDRLLPLPAWSQSSAFTAFRQALLAAPEGLDAAGVALHFNRSQHAAKLGFSHYALLAPQPETPAASAPAAPAPLPRLSWPRPGVALLSIPSFALDAAQMLPAAQALAAARPEALIIDLRGNAGGALPAAASLLGLLAPAPVDAGVFLSRRWYGQGRDEPDAAALAQMPALATLDLAALSQALQTTGVARLRIPASPAGGFRGRLLVLIDGHTASTSEPVAWLLRQALGARLIGQHTAGAMLSSEALPLAGGYRLRLPVADYLTPSSKRLDGHGVQPDLQVPPEQALQIALETLG